MAIEQRLDVILQATDKMSGVINSAVSNATAKFDAMQNRLKHISATAQNVSISSAFAAASIGGAMAHPLKMFSEYDSALAGLKTSMMNFEGVVDNDLLKSLDKYSIELGNKFKGNAADMTKMFYELTTNGVEAKYVLQGLGEATAQYATLTGQSYEEVGKRFGRLVNEMGILNEKLYPTPEKQREAFMTFSDQLQRAHYMGVKPDELMYAFGRSAGGLKLIAQQGVEAFKGVMPFYAMMIRGGASGEKAGTNAVAMYLNMLDPKRVKDANESLASFGKHIKLAFVDSHGNLERGEGLMRSLFAQAEKLQGLSDREKAIVGKDLMGGGYDQQIWNMMVSAGTKGYDEFKALMERQADIQKRNAEIQQTLSLTWENTKSIFENVEITWVKTFDQDLKRLMTGTIQPYLEKVRVWVESHQELAKMVALGAISLAGFAAVTAVVAGFVYITSSAIRNLVVFGGLAIRVMSFLTGFTGISGGLMSVANSAQKAQQMTALMSASTVAAGSRLSAFQKILSILRVSLLGWVGPMVLVGALAYKYWVPIQEFFAALSNGFGRATEGSGGNLASVFQTISSGVESAYNWLNKFLDLMTRREGSSQTARSWGDSLGMFMGSGVKSLDQWLGDPNKFNGLKSIFASVGGALYDYLLAPLGRIGKALVGMPGVLLDGLPSWKGITALIGSNIRENFNNAVNSIKSLFTTLPAWFKETGAKIIDYLVDGIKSRWSKVMSTLTDLTNQMMNFFPRSPAKTGPLRDLSKISIVQGIADTMKPAPLIKATEKVAQATRTSVNRNLVMPRSGAGGGVTHHYSPTIHVDGGSSDIRSEVEQALKVAFKQYARKQTLSYAT